MFDVIIVGGGVMGLTLAYELCQSKKKILILDQGHFGHGASWAGGGIISPLYPWRYLDPISDLCALSEDLFPNMVEHLKIATGIDPELMQSGLLFLEVPDERPAKKWAHQRRRHCASLTTAQLEQDHQLYGFERALYFPEVFQIRNPRLIKALVHFLRNHPSVTMGDRTQVLDFVPGKHHVSVRTDKNVFIGHQVVFCAGAWTGSLLKSSLGRTVTMPIKGQMLAIQATPGFLNSMILYRNHYLIPRRDGLILVGSTLERVGFDALPTKQAFDILFQAAVEMMPELRRFPICAQWTGFRPGADRDLPFIGPVPEHENVYMMTGHYRNGLLLSPGSARLMSALMNHETLPLSAAEFSVA